MDFQRICKTGTSHPWSKDVPGFVKELGYFERMEAVIQEDCDSLLSHALFLTSKIEITPEFMMKTLKRMVAVTPQLRHCLRNYTPPGSNKAVPVLVDKPDHIINFEVLDTSDWKQVLTEEWKRNYNLYGELPWRVKLLPNVDLKKTDDLFKHECVVIFSCSHVLFDGIAYQVLFGRLLDTLEEVYNEHSVMEPAEVFPSLDYYLGEEISFSEKAATLVIKGLIKTRMGRKIIMKLTGLGEKNPYIAKVPLPIESDPSIPIETRILPVEFTKEETKDIIRACKTRGVTVHGALNTAVAASFIHTLLPENCSSSKMPIQAVCAVNLRFLMGDNAKSALGQYALFFELKSTIQANILLTKSEEFWKLAKDCSKNIKGAINQKEYLDVFKTLRMVIPLIEGTNQYSLKDFATEAQGRQSVPFCLTNMGKNDFLTRGNDANFKLVGRYGGGSEHNGGYIIMHNVNTFNDQICMSMIYSPHIIHKAQVEKHAEAVKNMLKQHCYESEL